MVLMGVLMETNGFFSGFLLVMCWLLLVGWYLTDGNQQTPLNPTRIRSITPYTKELCSYFIGKHPMVYTNVICNGNHSHLFVSRKVSWFLKPKQMPTQTTFYAWNVQKKRSRQAATSQYHVLIVIQIDFTNRDACIVEWLQV